MFRFFTNNRTKTVIALSTFMLLSSFNIIRRENVQAKENMNIKAHKSYENLLIKYKKNIKKTAGVYFDNYEYEKKLNPKKVTVNFAYHDFNKDKIDELVVKFGIKGEEDPLYEEVLTYHNGRPKQVTVKGWYGGAGGQYYTTYYYDSEYFLEGAALMLGAYEDYCKLKDGKLKKEISFFYGEDKKINDRIVSEIKYESTKKKYNDKRGKYGIKLIKLTSGNLKKYRKAYNSEAFKGKKLKG